MRSKDKARLCTDLVRISDQIGILSNERPKLILDRKEMQNLILSRHIRDTGNPIHDKSVAGYGQCEWCIRTIFVDAGKQYYQRKRYGGRKFNRYIYRRKVKATYKDKLHVLVHELVHYRWAYLSHGRQFEKRTSEVIRGRRFEPKHVHLFANYPKSYRALIDG